MSEWISVKDRLPEKNTVVLVYFVKGILQLVDTAFFVSKSRWIDGDLRNWDDEFITHWMPLPAPPEVK